MIYADEYYHIGVMHRGKGNPCQDHALAYVDEAMAFGAIADGCSQGGHTDVGARIINYATLQALKRCELDDEADVARVARCVQARRMASVSKVQKELGLRGTDLIATNLYAYVSPQMALVHVVGDGVVAMVDRDGNIDVRRFLWADNAPYYPFYDLSQKQQFIQFHGNNLLAGRLTEERWHIDYVGLKTHVATIVHTLMQGMEGVVIDLFEEQKNKALTFVAVFSDGVEQVDGIDWLDAVVQCLAYKQTAGMFVKRRMMRFIKEISKIYKGPQDDMACATIHIPQDLIIGGDDNDESS